MRLTASLKQICKVLTRSISECYLIIDVNDAPTNQGMPRIASELKRLENVKESPLQISEGA